MIRCQHCGDPCERNPDPRYGDICDKCGAWSDLYFAFHAMPALDGRCLDRARAYFEQRRRVPTDTRIGMLEATVAKLIGRVRELEAIEADR